MSSYIPKNIVVLDCDIQLFEKIANANPRFLRMNLIEGRLEIMAPFPTSHETSMLYFDTTCLFYVAFCAELQNYNEKIVI